MTSNRIVPWPAIQIHDTPNFVHDLGTNTITRKD